MRYSLANYICTITPTNPTLYSIYGSIVIGGQGTETDSITASRSQSLFSTSDFATGGYVHNKNLSKVGNITVTLSQLSKNVSTLKNLINAYTDNDYSGLSITISTNDGTEVVTGIDCMPTQIPQQEFRNSASNQSYGFTCGEVNFK